MKLLVIDTSGPVCGVAVTDGDRVLCEYTVQNRNTHSANLMPMIDEAFRSAGLELKDMDAIAAVVGPGSFTGVRIGIATAKGLAHGSGKPCIPVNALEALSRNLELCEGTVCPIQDARAGQVYGAAFARKERLMDDRPMMIDDYADMVGRFAAPYLFVGDGVPVYREKIAALLGESAVFAPPQLCYIRPSAAAVLACEKGKMTDYPDLKEYYLRAPNAEKNKKLLEAMKHG